VTSRFKDHILGPDTHANRPAASGVPEAALYECTTHGLIYKNVAGTWVTYGTLVPPGGTTGQSLVKASATDGDVNWSTVSGGGGSTIKDRRWVVAASSTSIDEFNDDSLDAAWVRVDGTGAPSGNCVWTEGADVLSMVRAGANTANAMNGIVRPIGTAPATGDAWITCISMHGPLQTNYLVNGLVISDGTTHGAGKQIAAELISDTSAARQTAYAIAWTNWTTAGTQATVRPIPPPGPPTFLRLVYKGSSQWRADSSPDGVNWILGASLVTLSSFTPSHVGFYSRDGGTGTLWVASHEFLRRTSGVS
jgi:hypothetical protein